MKRKASNGMTEEYGFLKELGLEEYNHGVFDGTKWCGNESDKNNIITCVSPTTNNTIGYVYGGDVNDYNRCLENMELVKNNWQITPAPKRGEVVRIIGEHLRKFKTQLGSLISLEMGKIITEGLGEVQEFIDMCDYAVGLSRTFEGKMLPSERQGHVLMERWNPLGHIGVITAFNFPNAVIGWNLCLALVCGDTVIWKAASTVSLVAIATTKIIQAAIKECGFPSSIFTLCQGSGKTVGEALISDHRLKLISFTGSTSVGTRVAEKCASRFCKTILELGGNNGIIAMEDANLDLLLPGVVFGCIGTSGQRCTSTRRLFLHQNIYDNVIQRLVKAYEQVRIGDPLDTNTLMGPVHTKAAVKEYLEGIETIKKQGGKILYGGKQLERSGNFVLPTIVEISPNAEIIKTELFVPILYVFKFNTFEHAIEMHNNVPQGLSSAIFTQNQSYVWKFTGALGSDCGLANVNTGTSGAEIGGAFGSAKEGIGSEAGSDSWKQYCRRTTSAVNYSDKLPLSQGLKFE